VFSLRLPSGDWPVVITVRCLLIRASNCRCRTDFGQKGTVDNALGIGNNRSARNRLSRMGRQSGMFGYSVIEEREALKNNRGS
jgi:hypothetical protein